MVIRIFLSRRPVKINKFPKKKMTVIWNIQQKAAISQVTNGELEKMSLGYYQSIAQFSKVPSE